MNTRARSVAFLGLCVALSLILAYVEILLPPISAAAPGIKMGLPNLIIMFLFYRKGLRAAATVSLLRVVLVSMLFGNVTAFLYSAAGAVLSLAVMTALRRLQWFSVVGVSISGAVAHNLGQILMAMLLFQTVQLGYYFAVLVVSGIVAGVLIGLGTSALIRRIPPSV